MLKKITAVMLVGYLGNNRVVFAFKIAIFNRTKWMKIRFWQLKFWQLFEKRLNYADFHEIFSKHTTFDFNKSSVMGIIIINNINYMKQSRISSLLTYFIFNCCYLHGVGRIKVVTAELRQFLLNVRLKIFLKVSILNGAHNILGIFSFIASLLRIKCSYAYIQKCIFISVEDF